MAHKCPECGSMAYTRTSSYEAPTVKRSWYQCRNIECSCTFTTLESIDKIIVKPLHHEQAAANTPVEPVNQRRTLGRYGSACKLSSRQQIPV
ncbi:hypothetical protein C9426_20860 [Serratia sp. S1B]|nr:hypothetical protein C9426_20860 [Serratia sp. S1B]